ncbi:hypothetical protein PMI14_01255 [Acidovorax sp. CF316]|uniref:YcxB family protein n=1 Tax=Acidovorax sp. CF316 TaxID=1144317 RepID=UPI00026BBED0|nr:YcxB family protein [Acidovorax sp. CF316]EJE53841.1 hypothetical protein PMI14_01255 [Acidovorax sp. CF316]
MQTFTLTRSDYVLAHERTTAHLRALASRRRAASAAGQGTVRKALVPLAKVAAWLLVFAVTWVFLQTRDPGSRAMGYMVCAAITAAVTLVLAYVAGVAMTRRQLQEQLSDDGSTLSPQSVVVSESGIEQHAKGAFSRLDWAFFIARQEDEAMFYLFVEPGMCMMVPKAVLPPEARALIARHLPLAAT